MSTPTPENESIYEARRVIKPWEIWRWPLHFQILLGLAIGAIAGYLIGQWALGQLNETVSPESAGATASKIVSSSYAFLAFDLVGDLFIQGLKLIIVPLVTSSIILAVANLSSDGKDSSAFGRMAGKTLGYYLTTSIIAVLIGLALINLIAPGTNDEGQGILVGQDISAFESEQSAVQNKAGGKQATDFLDVFREMVPPNLISAAAEAKLLGLIVTSMIVGFFLGRYQGDGNFVIKNFVQGVYDITLKITDLVLKLAPIGIVGLIAATVSVQYAKLAPDNRFDEFITGIVLFAGTALGALLTHFLIVMPLLLMVVARVNPLKHYQAMAPALMTAFSTASSSATLPLTIDCVENRAGVSNKTASFVLPLGATVNMDGTALYECVAAIFICQAFGIELTFAQQFMIVVTAVLTSIGVAGVPAASLVAIVVILTAVQNALPPGTLPEGMMLVAGMGLLFVFDRPLDMCRTAVNIFSDSVGAVVIARSEGEKPLSN